MEWREKKCSTKTSSSIYFFLLWDFVHLATSYFQCFITPFFTYTVYMHVIAAGFFWSSEAQIRDVATARENSDFFFSITACLVAFTKCICSHMLAEKKDERFYCLHGHAWTLTLLVCTVILGTGLQIVPDACSRPSRSPYCPTYWKCLSPWIFSLQFCLIPHSKLQESNGTLLLGTFFSADQSFWWMVVAIHLVHVWRTPHLRGLFTEISSGWSMPLSYIQIRLSSLLQKVHILIQMSSTVIQEKRGLYVEICLWPLLPNALQPALDQIVSHPYFLLCLDKYAIRELLLCRWHTLSFKNNVRCKFSPIHRDTKHHYASLSLSTCCANMEALPFSLYCDVFRFVESKRSLAGASWWWASERNTASHHTPSGPTCINMWVTQLQLAA